MNPLEAFAPYVRQALEVIERADLKPSLEHDGRRWWSIATIAGRACLDERTTREVLQRLDGTTFIRGGEFWRLSGPPNVRLTKLQAEALEQLAKGERSSWEFGSTTVNRLRKCGLASGKGTLSITFAGRELVATWGQR